ILFNESVVLAEFSFWEMLRIAMPLTAWWQQNIPPLGTDWSAPDLRNFARKLNARPKPQRTRGTNGAQQSRDATLLKKLINIASAIDCELSGEPETFEKI